MKNHAAVIAGSLAFGIIVVSGAAPPSGVRAAPPYVNVSVVDSAEGTPLPARCRVVDYLNRQWIPWSYPCFYHSGNGGYFYTAGQYTVYVPIGQSVFYAGHGVEHRELIDTINVTRDTAIQMPLGRIASMSEGGWYPGDSHVHINHDSGSYVLTPDDACFMGAAEGLSAVNCLDNYYFFTGETTACATEGCVVSMTEEWRSSSWGHMAFLGVDAIVDPIGSIWWPLAMDAADSCRLSRGGIVVSAHPVTTDDFGQTEDWPGSGLARELPVDMIAGRVDAFDVVSYSNELHGGIELDLWYRLLNCGFRLPASAGTDCVMNHSESLPLGGYRAYVRFPSGGFDFRGWLDGLAAGRTFVTNGPLVTAFSVGGLEPGDAADVPPPAAPVGGSISIRSVHPVSMIEIIMNGQAAVAMPLSPPRRAIDTTFSVNLPGSAWIAARVTGPKAGWMTVGPQLFAHTSPVYFTVWGERVVDRDDAEFFALWIASLEALAAAKGEWPNTAARDRAFAELAAGREFYEDLAAGALSGVEGGTPPEAFRRSVVNMPNPFGASTSIEFDVPSAEAASSRLDASPRATVVSIYDVAGRRIRRLLDAPLEPGRHRVAWDCRDDGGSTMPSGVYFVRVVCGGVASQGKLIVVR